MSFHEIHGLSNLSAALDKLANAARIAADAYAKSVDKKSEGIVYNINVEARSGATAAEIAQQIKEQVRSRSRV